MRAPSGIWGRLDDLLRTDPNDAGCEQTWRLINEYAEIVLSGGHPETQWPGLTAHLDRCDPCRDDYRGLLHVMRAAAPA